MNLYRRSTLQASLVLLLASMVGLTVAAAQRRKPHKLRATALVEISTDHSGTTTARLVPITILDEGSFHDAGIYKAAPEPMSLDSGVVYEAQKTGQPVGYVTVKNAGKDKNGNWAALGRWQLVSAEPKAQASASPAAGAAPSADDRPILHRSGSASSPPPAASPTPGSGPASAPSDDRPVLRRPTGDTSAQSTPSPAATPAATPTPATPEPEPEDPDRPTLRHRTPQSVHEESNSASPSRPAQPAAAPVTTPSRPASAPSAASGTQALVAVSDAQASDSRSYEFIWKPGEREAIEAKMRRLALAQLPHDAGAALTEKSLTNVVIRTFDLDLSNDAVVVLTAELPPGSASAPTRPAGKSAAKAGTRSPSSPKANAAPAATPVTRYITLIARVDFEGNPQKLAASLTDSSRLDVAPRLELIDAVDVDGDALAELLFREYSFDDKSFVIFSIGRGSVTKIFEGASQPLK